MIFKNANLKKWVGMKKVGKNFEKKSYISIPILIKKNFIMNQDSKSEEWNFNKEQKFCNSSGPHLQLCSSSSS